MKTKEEVLKNCTIENNVVKLPNVQLERKLYQDVAKSLEMIGGKWKGNKISGFVFLNDPTELLNEICDGNNINLKKEFQFFETPEKLSDELVNLAEINETDSILEPSAGQGSIIKSINKVSKIIPDCYELMEINKIVLQNKISDNSLLCNIIGSDFLQHNGKKYSKIIANPPFSKNQDIEHLIKMYDTLSVGGKLVCITSKSWVSGNQKKQIEFKDWLTKIKAKIIDIENGVFKDSGTMVGGKIIVIDKLI